ncbi:NAD+ diphosphatase [Curtobacterium sp. PhB130]|uniref:NAD(+) diphosphatase n=1 Tax=Curtobacterium sp. PhB130 TaxID=2485178 RepID=UPI000F4B3523|nr:NAD+ diphosphatase [Curtobacterium sp. PhB130]
MYSDWSVWADSSGWSKEARRATELWSRPQTRLLLIDEGDNVSVTETGTLAMRPVSGEWDEQSQYLLGVVGTRPTFASRLAIDGESIPVREALDRFGPEDRSCLSRAISLLRWHSQGRYCSNCGGPTSVFMAGWARRCAECGELHFPRTDPAVIVAIVDGDDRLLLGGEHGWGTRLSVFAGFVDAGESAEQALHREAAEEVGLQLHDVRYFGSQPWPFPRSLMLAYFARAASGDFRVDGAEIQRARWFSRGQLTSDLASGTVVIPPPSSIANRMIVAWLEDRWREA